MYVPAGLLFVLALFFFMVHDNRPLPGWLCTIGLIAFAVYAPGAALIVGALLALILVPVGLFFLYAGTMHLLEKGAKALPNCWLFDGPTPTAAPPVVLVPEIMDVRVARARRALLAASHR